MSRLRRLSEDAKDKRAREATMAAIALFLRKGRRAVSSAFRSSASDSADASLPIAVANVRGAVAKAVLQARTSARLASQKALEAHTGERLPLSLSGAAFDPLQSKSAADALSIQWRDEVAAIEQRSAALGRSVPRNLYAKAAEEREWAAERTARTATMDAFNRESRAAAKELASRGHAVERVWCSLLELRTCAICYGLHGTVVGANEEFSEGEPPLHPDCPCFVETRIAE